MVSAVAYTAFNTIPADDGAKRRILRANLPPTNLIRIAPEIDSGEFYDSYVGRQLAVGVNARHHAIKGWLRDAGLRKGHRVLELGCGIGTLTGLIADEVGADGSVVAIDLSPKSIEVASARLSHHRNVELIAADVLEVELAGQFDVAVLPDVIEHIPVEHHRALFERVAASLAPTGFVLLNYPSPHYLDWCREHDPQSLQLIDQSIQADQLLADVYPSGLYLDLLKTYSIWISEGDYVVAVLRPAAAQRVFTTKPEQNPSVVTGLIRRARAKVEFELERRRSSAARRAPRR